MLAAVDGLKYQSGRQLTQVAGSNELLALKLRYKQPEADTSTRLLFPVKDSDTPFAQGTTDFQMAAAVAVFGMLLRHSEHKGTSNYDLVLELATLAVQDDQHGYRAEFLNRVCRAKNAASGRR